MSLVAPSRARERILVYGMEGVGKSKGIYQIAEAIPNTIQMYIIETDASADEFLESYSHLRLGSEYRMGLLNTQYCVLDGNIHVYHCRNWIEIRQAFKEVWKKAKWDDWVVIDNMTWCWQHVQNWYVEQVFGKSIDEHLLDIRVKQVQSKDGKNHTAMEGMFADWTAINPQYDDVIRKSLMDQPCHIYMTAHEKKVNSDAVAKDKALQVYQQFGAMPDGQKALGRDARTVLWLTKDVRFGTAEHKFTSVKDRERRLGIDEPWSNFGNDYLVNIANWSSSSTNQLPVGEAQNQQATGQVAKKVSGIVKKG